MPILPRALAASALSAALLAAGASSAAAATTDLTVWGVTPDRSTAAIGDTVTYAFDVRNTGSEASAATFTDRLGEGETLVSASSSAGTCSQTAPATCELAEIPAGGSVTVTVATRVTKAATVRHEGTVSPAPGTTDTFADDDTNNASVLVEGPPERDAPYVETTWAEENQVSLDLGGKVAPQGTAEVFFEYGATRSYGRKTAVKRLDTTKLVKVGARAGGLRMGTTYHYRVVLVVEGRTYRGKDVKAKTLSRFDAQNLTLAMKPLSPSKAVYSGKLKKGRFVDHPAACSGDVEIEFYPDGGADFLRRTAKLKKDCTYAITIPFGVATARRHGPKGKVYVQAFFQGNAAVNRLGSAAVKP